MKSLARFFLWAADSRFFTVRAKIRPLCACFVYGARKRVSSRPARGTRTGVGDLIVSSSVRGVHGSATQHHIIAASFRTVHNSTMDST